jgi:hypothetical protein
MRDLSENKAKPYTAPDCQKEPTIHYGKRKKITIPKPQLFFREEAKPTTQTGQFEISASLSER